MVTLRFGLQKHFIRTRDLDIINNDLFKSANDTFKAMLSNLKREGKGDVVHKDIISDEDLNKIYNNLSLDTPDGLQLKVWFYYMIFNCNRGRENLRDMKKTDIEVKTDGSGARYVDVMVSRESKNHKGDDLQDDNKSRRIYEQPGNPNCRVLAFEKYLLKLNPGCEALWQHPRTSGDWEADDVWYGRIPVGKNTLGSMMNKISEKCQLSKIYTNHCIRATCITILDEGGFESRHIMGVSGHKSETSLKSYSSHVSEKKCPEMSTAISERLGHAQSDPVVDLRDTMVENITLEDIDVDPSIQEFLSPSKEDTLLASLTDVFSNFQNVPRQPFCTLYQQINYGLPPFPFTPGLQICNYGTMNLTFQNMPQ